MVHHLPVWEVFGAGFLTLAATGLLAAQMLVS